MLVLCGFKGCGKSTYGRLLAEALDVSFLDTDHLIGDPRRIYQTKGESAFRKLEQEMIATIQPGPIVATGGGSVLDSTNVELLRRLGPIVYLKAQPQLILGRLTRDWPAFLSSKEDFYQMYEERAPIYRSVSDETIDTAGLTDDEVVSKLTQLVRDHGEQ